MIKGDIVKTTEEFKNKFNDWFYGEIIKISGRGVARIKYDTKKSSKYYTCIDLNDNGETEIHISWLEKV